MSYLSFSPFFLPLDYYYYYYCYCLGPTACHCVTLRYRMSRLQECGSVGVWVWRLKDKCVLCVSERMKGAQMQRKWPAHYGQNC